MNNKYKYELLEKEINDNLWKRIISDYKFKSSFDFGNTTYYEYDIKEANIDNYNTIMNEIFLSILESDEIIYVLDWKHQGFSLDPRIKKLHPNVSYTINNDEVFVNNVNGNIFFERLPTYYPDGDYYFFLSSKNNWMYFSHPRQKKIWIIGDSLNKEIMLRKNKLNINKIK